MRAVVYHRYGPTEMLRFEDVEQPKPNDDEVLIEIGAGRSTCVCLAAVLATPRS